MEFLLFFTPSKITITIKFHTAQQLNRIKDEFHAICNFPNVVGAIDGTLIPIQGMTSEEEPYFICRKGFHTINVQSVVTADLR